MKTWKIILLVVSTTLLIAPLTAYATTSMFADVPNDHIFVDHINWMKTAGITNGCGDGTNYCPNDDVTRGQMAAFMHRLATGRTVDAGTLDGKDSDDYIYDAEWVEKTATFSGVAPGGGALIFLPCPTNKYVVSGGGQSIHREFVISTSTPSNADTGWSVAWTNTGSTTIRPTLTARALCAGPGLIALP